MKTRPKRATMAFFKRLGFEASKTSFKWRSKEEGGKDVPNFLKMLDRAQSRPPSDEICY